MASGAEAPPRARPPAARAARWRVEAIAALACAASAIVLTWPLAAVFTTRLGGDYGDPYQTLWSMRWMRDALVGLQNPFYTYRLHHPHGATLVFQTFDIPSALLVAPLWDRVPEVAVYNTAVLCAFALTAYGMFHLARELTGDVLCAVLAGIVFAAVPYHFAHLKGHLHLVSMGWLPLALVHLVRMLHGTARPRDPVLAGLFLGLAALASWYHVAFALVVVPVLLAWGAVARRATVLTRGFARALLVAAATFLAVAGPLLAAIFVIRAREDITGAHDAVMFSADLYAFVLPNAAQGWAQAFGAHAQRWTGNSEEIAAYAGVVVLALAVAGALADGLARAFVVAAVIGAVLALGPRLHVDGRVLPVVLPYGYLEALAPPLAFMGVPVRFGYVMYLGLVAAAACGLAALRRRAAALGPMIGVAAALVVTALALVEYRPRPLFTWSYPVPAPIRAWTDERGAWAVLDATDDFRQLWHGTIHRRPMIGGYLSRAPRRLQDWLHRQPVLAATLWGAEPQVVERVDPALDFAWGASQPDPSFQPGDFVAGWRGTLLAPAAGHYRFLLTASGAAVLALDGRAVAGGRDACPADRDICQSLADVDLAAGPHPLRVAFAHRGGDAALHLAWQPPGEEWRIVPPAAFRTAAGETGLDARYEQPGHAVSGLGREAGRQALRDLNVRYVIGRETGNVCVERELELPRVYAGEGVRIYEVPP